MHSRRRRQRQTEGNQDHVGMGFFVVCDDTEREYGSDEKAAEYYEKVEKEGWTPFSMADDWKTIYGEGVQKTELPGTENMKAAEGAENTENIENTENTEGTENTEETENLEDTEEEEALPNAA